MVLHKLNDDPDVVGVVLDGDDPHDVGGVLGVRVLAVLVGQHEAGVSLMDLLKGMWFGFIFSYGSSLSLKCCYAGF